MKKPAFIVNPNAANGTAAKIWPALADKVRARVGEFTVLFTERMGHAMELARRAAADGADLVVSVGGDGTLNEVVNGLLKPDGMPVNPEAALAQICIGTGGDFRKTTGLPKEQEGALAWLAGEKTLPLDIGKLEMHDHQDRPVTRFFANIASLGIGGDIDDRVNRTTKLFGGFASFFWGSLVSMLRYKNKPVHLILDDEKDLGVRKVFSVAVANGRFFGGGMQVAPNADLRDGLFDIVIMGDLTMGEKLTEMPKIYKAGHLGHPKIEFYRGRKLTATSAETVLLDVDGEAPGKLPTTFTLLPAALRLKVQDD